MGWYDSTIEILWFHTLFSFFFFLRKQSFMRCCWLPSQTILLSIYLPPNRICRQSFRSSPWQRKCLKCLHAVRSMQTFKLNFLSQLLDEMRYVWKAPEVFFNKKPTSRFHNSTDINYCWWLFMGFGDSYNCVFELLFYVSDVSLNWFIVYWDNINITINFSWTS